jgi:GT2 family glycosyltransferase
MYPPVSIIIVTYNNLDLTKACIESIYANSHYPNLELVIVDNNSSDGTRDYLNRIQNTYSNISLILNDDNKGFAPANNQGMRKASGENIILLNNDTIVTPGWISKLNHYLKDKSIGMVGPVTNMCGNEAIINVPYDVSTLEGFDEFLNSFFKRSMKGDSFEIDMLSMFCVAMRRETVNEIGLLDERFKTGMFEDTDYSYRIKEKGYKLICAKDIFIHHCCRASFGKLPANEYNKIYEENRVKFEEKWSTKSKY